MSVLILVKVVTLKHKNIKKLRIKHQKNHKSHKIYTDIKGSGSKLTNKDEMYYKCSFGKVLSTTYPLQCRPSTNQLNDPHNLTSFLEAHVDMDTYEGCISSQAWVYVLTH